MEIDLTFEMLSIGEWMYPDAGMSSGVLEFAIVKLVQSGVSRLSANDLGSTGLKYSSVSVLVVNDRPGTWRFGLPWLFGATVWSLSLSVSLLLS